MRIFLDTSVLLAACQSATGASRFLCEESRHHGWNLLVSPYVITEVERNLEGRAKAMREYWEALFPSLVVVDDVLTISHAVEIGASKDKPVLLSAYAFADLLLTHDRQDFAGVLGTGFYGLSVLKPADFLIEQRKAGKI